MKYNLFKKCVSTAVMIAYTTLTTLIPAGQVQAAPICDASNPTTAAGGTPGCAVKQFPSGAFAYAKLDWTQVAEMSQSPTSGINLTMAGGDRVVASNNRTAAALGLKANQVADVMSLFPTNVPFVFGRYNPGSHELRVDIFKIEKANGAMRMMQAPFTPAHGGAFAAAMIYATPADRANGFNPGANPFSPYQHPGQDAFYGVGDLGTAKVALSLAMRMSGASIGLLAQSSTRPNQTITKSGGWLKKTVTTTVEGWTKPEWFVGTPQQFQPQGTTERVCAIAVANAADCPKELAVASGISWSQWEGGSLPAFEDMTSTWSESQSSLTVLAWVVVVFLVVATAGALAVAAGAGATALGPATFIQGLMSAGAAGVGGGAALTMNAVLATAAIEAAAVGGVSALMGAGLTDAAVAPYAGARSGFNEPLPPSEAAARSVYDGVRSKFDTATISGTGVRAVSQGLYGAGCAPGQLASACASSGVVPRADLGTQSMNTQFWQDNGKPLLYSNPLKQ